VPKSAPPAPPKTASAPEGGTRAPSKESYPRASYIAPFAFIAGVAGVATFYLPQFLFPVLFSLTGLGLGILSLRQGPVNRLAKIAMGLGGVGLFLQLITYLTA
jgi:hypothetical protein